MTTAKHASSIHDLTQKSALVLPSDMFVFDRDLGGGIWQNFRISGTDLASEITAGISSSAYTLPGEIENKDGWSVDFFEDYAVGTPTLNKGIGWDGDGAGSGLSVVNRNIYTAKTENRLVISGGQFARKLYFGDAWNRILIGLMFRINGAASFTGDGYVGLCSGTSNMVASPLCDNFVGIRWEGVANTVANSWAFSAGTRVNKYNQSTGTRFVTRRAALDNDRGSGVGSDGRTFSASEGYRSMLLLDIKRPVFATDATSIQYDMGVFSTDVTQVEFSLSKRSFVAALMDVVTSTLAGGSMAGYVMGAAAVRPTGFNFDQSTGKLDALNISWPNATQTMELSAIAVRKVF